MGTLGTVAEFDVPGNNITARQGLTTPRQGLTTPRQGLTTAQQGLTTAQQGEVTPKTRDAVDGGIAKMIQRLHGMPPAGGQFRSVVFGLAAELTRREIARGTTTDNVMVQMRQIFADHPQRLTMNADDEQ